MSDLVTFYIAFSPLTILFLARAVAVSRQYRRLPIITEIIRDPAGVNGRDLWWLQFASRFFYWWFGFFFVGWLMGVRGSDDFVKNIIGVLGITAFHVGCIGQAVRVVMFNVVVRPDGIAEHEEKKLYREHFRVFPGFKDSIDFLISTSSVLLIILVFLMVLIGVWYGHGSCGECI